jgi:YcaO-like protein with predicted kinase domain
MRKKKGLRRGPTGCVFGGYGSPPVPAPAVLLGLSRAAAKSLPSASLQRRFGVTRIARVTGLDRTGVEVACAIRPQGHVLQVSNGKGRTLAEAARGALCEAAELWAAEHPDPVRLVWGSEEELARHLGRARVWGAHLFEEEALWPEGVRSSWSPARELPSGAEVLVPASAVYCPPPEGPYLGPATVTWTSNGLAAHPRLARAQVHALLEACERHLLALALPEGFTPDVLGRFGLSHREVQQLAPGVARRVAQLATRGFQVVLLLPSPGRAQGAVQLPLAAALLFDEEEGPHPVTAGYACRLTVQSALEAALLEAAQSRLTDIHGAREDICGMDREAAAQLRRWCREAPPPRRRRREASELREGRPLAGLLTRLKQAGFHRVACAQLETGGQGLCVVKALVPGFLRSELL